MSATGTLTVNELKSLEIALAHGVMCKCSNCTTAIFAVQREVKPFKAVGHPRKDDIEKAEREVSRAQYELAEAHRKLALLVGSEGGASRD